MFKKIAEWLFGPAPKSTSQIQVVESNSVAIQAANTVTVSVVSAVATTESTVTVAVQPAESNTNTVAVESAAVVTESTVALPVVAEEAPVKKPRKPRAKKEVQPAVEPSPAPGKEWPFGSYPAAMTVVTKPRKPRAKKAD